MTNTVSTSISTGITLTPTGIGQAPFIITSTGTINPAGYSAIGVYGSAAIGNALYLVNDGLITGGNGVSPGGNGGFGGAGVDLIGGTVINTGTITGGVGGNGGNGGNGGFGGAGVDLHNVDKVTNFGTIGGGNGGFGGTGGPSSNGNGGNGGFGGAGLELSSGTVSNFSAITGGNGAPGAVGAFGLGNGNGGNGGNGGAGVDLNGGMVSNTSTITGGNGGPGAIGAPGGTGGTYGTGGAGVYLNGGTLLDSGMIVGGTNGSRIQADAVQFGATVGTLVIEAGAAFTGKIVANISAPDILAIGGTTSVILAGIGSQFQNFRNLVFDSGSSGTISGSYTAFSPMNITGFAPGDTIILDGFAATSDTYVSNVGLELSNGTSHITIDITGSFSTADFNVIDPPANTTISVNVNGNPPCFAAGTRILTTRGEIAVENLTLNDHVVLHTGTTAPIQWLGHRTLSLRHHPRPEQVNPIHIQAGALADNIPHRDLIVSPDHALYLDGALIPAKALLNGSTIRQDSPPRITYYHVELPTHAILLAEGTPTESYLETGNRHAFTNGSNSHITLHPNLAQTQREQQSCAPFTESGPLVEAVRARILARANIPLTTDPALTLQTNPDGSVAIISRSAIPGQLNADPRDQRRLGVKIASLEIGGETIALDHPLLTEGWHTTEPDGRWTNGRSVIPAELVRGEKIILAPAATLAYPADQRTSQHAA